MKPVTFAALLLLLPHSALHADEQPATAPVHEGMTIERLDELLREHGSDVRRGPNVWTLVFNEVRLTCLISPAHDRMRIVTPIVPVSELTELHKDKMLAANFHTALDVRYGTDDGIVYSAFIHPLSPLDEAQLASALRQVSTLARTFGTVYSSGELIFGAPNEQSDESEPDTEEKEEEKIRI